MLSASDLNRGFIQQFLEANGGGVEQPTLQVLDARPLVSNQEQSESQAKYYRFRLSDGMFSYNSCLSQEDIVVKVRNDKLDTGNPVIKIRYTLKPGQLKPLLRIMDYDIIGRDLPVLGNPVPHSGNPKDYTGLNPSSSVQSIGTTSNYQPISRANLDIGARAKLCLPGAQNITPIKLITPYVNKWRICGMVTAKEDLRDVKTARRDMKVFNFELTDSEGCSIRVAAFDDLADKYYAFIQKNAMYYLSGGAVKQANKRFNNTGHDYEITIRNDSEISSCMDREKFEKPKLALNVVRLDKVGNYIGQTIDVLAVIDKVNEITQVTARGTGNVLEKREILLIDSSEKSIALTLWADQSRMYDSNAQGQTIGVKGAFVREYNGSLSLSVGSSSRLELNLDCPETARLYKWYTETRPSVKAVSLTTVTGTGDSFSRDLRVIGISEIIGLGRGIDKGMYFNVCAMITTLKADGALYKSCGNSGCKKKVLEIDNQFRCEKCNITLDSYKYVLLLPMEISDFTGSHWVTVFEDKAVKLLNTNAEELGKLLDSDQLDEYNKAFSAVRFRQFTFRIRAKSEFYNGAEKIKWNIYDINEVNYDKYAEELTHSISVLNDESYHQR